MVASEVRVKVIGVLQEIQTLSGRGNSPITSQTRPIGDLEGFDSLNGEEATVLLEAELGCELKENVFITENGRRRALTVDEIVSRLCHLLGLEEGG